MWRIFVVMMVTVSLWGCASNPLSEVKNLDQKNLGDVNKVIWPETQARFSESENLKHWWKSTSVTTASKSTSTEGADYFIIKRLDYLGDYCNALGGNFTKASKWESADLRRGQTAFEVTCIKKTSDASSQKITDAVSYFRVVSAISNCKYMGQNQNFEHMFDCNVWTDSFQWKTPGTYKDVEANFKLNVDSNGFALGFATNTAAEEHRRALDQQRAEELKEAQEVSDRAWKEVERKKRERTVRDLAQAQAGVSTNGAQTFSCPTEKQKTKMEEALRAAKDGCIMDNQKHPEYQARWDDNTRSCISRGLTGHSSAGAQYYFDLSDCSAIKLMYRTSTNTYVARVITDQ